jgi:uncharacterized protein YfaS (alpha-2-macroglobulin family)
MKRLLKIILSLLIGFGLFAMALFLLWHFSPRPQVIFGSEINEVKEISFNAPFTIEFTAKMNKDSVQSNFKIVPQIAGTIYWKDAKTLVFKPEELLKINSRYTITIAAEAQDWLGKKIDHNSSQDYLIIGPPQVNLIDPISEYQWKLQNPSTSESNDLATEEIQVIKHPEIKQDQPLVIVFDRPIRFDNLENLFSLYQLPLSSDKVSELSKLLVQSEELSQKIKILEQLEPLLIPVEGEIRPFGDYGFQFLIANDDYPHGQRLVAYLRPGVEDLDGGQSENFYSWNYETPGPQIISISPADGSQYVRPESDLILNWNQPIDLSSLVPKNDIQFSPDPPTPGKARVISLNHKDDDRSKIVVDFIPNFPPDSKVVVKINPQVKSEVSAKVSQVEYLFEFNTLAEPRLLGSSQQISAGEDFAFFSSVPLDPESIKDNLRFEPPLKTLKVLPGLVSQDQGPDPLSETHDQGFALNSSYQYLISANYRPGVSYKWILDNQMGDLQGQLLGTSYQGQFEVQAASPPIAIVGHQSEVIVTSDLSNLKLSFKAPNLSFLNYRLCPLGLKQYRDLSIGETVSCGELEFISLENPQSTKLSQLDFSKTDIPLANYYLLEYSAPSILNNQVFQKAIITNNLFLSSIFSEKTLTLYANDLYTSQALSQFPITAFDLEGNQLFSGVTNTQGAWKIAANNLQNVAYFKASSADLEADLHLNWPSLGFLADSPELDLASSNLGNIFTSKSVYYSEESIQFAGYLPRGNSNLSELELAIFDPTGLKIASQKVPLSSAGTFSGEYLLPASLPEGDYLISASLSNSMITELATKFRLELDKRKQTQVKITNLKSQYFNPERLSFKLETSRQFGIPIKQGSISYQVFLRPLTLPNLSSWLREKPGHFKLTADPSSARLIQEGKQKIKEDEDFTVDIDLSNYQGQSYELIIKADFTDLDKYQYQSFKRVRVFSSETIIGLKTSSYLVAANQEEVNFEVKAFKSSGEAVADQDLTAQLYRVRWKSDQDGFFLNQEKYQFLSQFDLKLDQQGWANLNLDLEPEWTGELRLVVSNLDNSSKADLSFFVPGDSVEYPDIIANQVDVTTNQRIYEAGAKLKARIKADLAAGKEVLALITSGDQIIDQQKSLIQANNLVELDLPTDASSPLEVMFLIFDSTSIYSQVIKLEAAISDLKLKIEEVELIIADFEQRKTEALKSIEQLNQNPDAEPKELKIANAKLKTAERELAIQQPKLTVFNQDLQKQETELSRIQQEVDDDNYSSSERPARTLVGHTQIEFLNKLQNDLRINYNPSKNYPQLETSVTVELANWQTHNASPVFLALTSSEVRHQDFWPESVSSPNLFATIQSNFLHSYLPNQLILNHSQRRIYDNVNLPGLLSADSVWFFAAKDLESGKAQFELKAPSTSQDLKLHAFVIAKNGQVASVSRPFSYDQVLRPKLTIPHQVANLDHFTAELLINNPTNSSISGSYELVLTNLRSEQELEKQSFQLDPGAELEEQLNLQAFSQLDYQNLFTPAKINLRLYSEENDLLANFESKIIISEPLGAKTIQDSGLLTRDFESQEFKLPQDLVSDLGGLNLLVTNNFLADLQVDTLTVLNSNLDSAQTKALELLLALKVESLAGSRYELDLSYPYEQKLKSLLALQREDGGFGYYPGSHQSYITPSASALLVLANSRFSDYGDSKSELINYLQGFLAEQIIVDPNKAAQIIHALSEVDVNEVEAANNYFVRRSEMTLKSRLLLLKTLLNYRDDDVVGSVQNTELLLSEILAKINSTSQLASLTENGLSSKGANNAILLSLIITEDLNPELEDQLARQIFRDKLLASYELPWGSVESAYYNIAALIDFELKQSQSKIASLVVSLNKILKMRAYFDEADSSNLSQEVFIPLSDFKFDPEFNRLEFSKEKTDPLYYESELLYFEPKTNQEAKASDAVSISHDYYHFNDQDLTMPVSEVKQGDLLIGRVSFTVSKNLEAVQLSVDTPGGLTNLNFDKEILDLEVLTNNWHLMQNQYYFWWENLQYFNHYEVSKRGLKIYIDNLAPGFYEYQYLARADFVGQFQVSPAVIAQNNDPKNSATSRGYSLAVEAK